MSALAVAVFGFIALIATVWIFRTWSHHKTPVNTLIQSIDSTLAAKLYPFAESCEDTLSDSRLWDEIGGVQGIARMHRDAGVFVTLSIRIRKLYPEDSSHAMREMFRNALYLRLMTWLSIIEFLAMTVMPTLPRVQVRSCALLYCEIRSSLDVVLSICDHPTTGRMT
jgi:hypothetical protein